MKKVFCIVLLGVLVVLGPGTVYACYLQGRVFCDVNNDGKIDAQDKPLEGVLVSVVQTDGIFSESVTTDSNGYYYITLPDPPTGNFQATLGPGGLPADAGFVDPGSNTISFTGSPDKTFFDQDWLISSATCQAAGCWLTGGGLKFEPLIGAQLAERGTKNTFGGNVWPGCSPTAGEGGQWNHIAHNAKLHFQGWSVDGVRCGNVSGIPPGSTSPVTPYNYIEFWGRGTLKGISGNKVDFGDVYFFIRAEDRNEPGNEKASQPGGGAYIDRYFLNVYSDSGNPGGTSLFLLDVDGNPATVDPVTITGGNLQLHISSCP